MQLTPFVAETNQAEERNRVVQKIHTYDVAAGMGSLLINYLDRAALIFETDPGRRRHAAARQAKIADAPSKQYCCLHTPAFWLQDTTST